MAENTTPLVRDIIVEEKTVLSFSPFGKKKEDIVVENVVDREILFNFVLIFWT
jgi:hypothetical protein